MNQSSPEPPDSTPGSALTPEDCLIQNTNILACRVDSDLVLFDGQKGRYYGLNELGGAIFELTAGGRSLADIHAALSDRYAVDSSTLWSDLRMFSEHLLALDVVHRH